MRGHGKMVGGGNGGSICKIRFFLKKIYTFVNSNGFFKNYRVYVMTNLDCLVYFGGNQLKCKPVKDFLVRLFEEERPILNMGSSFC